jgi:NAD(P)-dependent dehydrogenase (short-subunit alcohol dehydrogenase family)
VGDLLEGKTALISGGSSGIGLATARRFIAEGAEVIIASRDQAKLDAAIGELGDRAMAIQVDVSQAAEIDRLYETVKVKHPRLDVVFANAGTSGEPTPLAQITEREWDNDFALNVKGVVFLVQKALPLMADGGAIVLTTSVANVKGIPGASAYSATKAAVRTFARTWTVELQPRRIRVNAVSPGPTDTPMHNNLGRDDPQVRASVEAMLQQVPVGRIGQPDDIAAAVAFLASDQAAFITGVELVVDGGLTQV